ncbi:MAG TPA: FHA domain-containing protein [Anaeromyxobacter sp.]|nr:FHA domain-containing protein [Anaeromyxobacter sp.]
MKLVIEDEAGTRSVVPFAGDAIVVGRGSEVTFRLADRNVSRRHARFVRQNGTVFVEDLGSLTGTRVNGERIAGKRKLREGDLVQIGDYDLAVLAEGAAVAPDAPPPLPAGGRDPNAITLRLDPQALPPPPEPPPRPRRRVLRITLVAGALALAAGAAAGWAVGALTASR